MKRDMALIRRIVLAAIGGQVVARVPRDVNYATWFEHLGLAVEGGLLASDGGVYRVTAAGQDFAALAADDAVWAAAEARVASIGGAPFSVWIELLEQMLKKRLGDGRTWRAKLFGRLTKPDALG